MSPIVDIRWYLIAPELALAVAATVSLLFAAARPRAVDPKAALGAAEWLAILGVAVAGVLALLVGMQTGARQGDSVHFWGGLTHDPFSAYFKTATAAAVLLVMAMTAGYRRAMCNRPEIYGLLALATLALFCMASASELVMVFLAVEFLSLTSYILVGYLKDSPRSAEAGLKYFLFGSVCAAVMLYGMSLLYGMTGATTLQGIAVSLAANTDPMRLQVAVVAALLVLAGLGFKIAMVPFHQWSPDAYQGAPTPITAFLSVASKAAGFAVLVRVLATAFGAPELSRHWAGILAVLAMVTMTWGNTAAIWQTDMKRMLAYSSIAQAGYILVGLAAAGLGGAATRPFALPGILLYVLAYIFMNLGAFAVVIAVANQTGSEEMSDYAGLAGRAPWLAALLTFFLLSLIGIPPTAGFLAKLYLFLAALRGQSPLLVTLAVVMFVNSVISAYYYLNVVRYMYLREAADPAPLAQNRALTGVLAVTALATLLLFLCGQPFIDAAQATVQASPLLHGITSLSAGW